MCFDKIGDSSDFQSEGCGTFGASLVKGNRGRVFVRITAVRGNDVDVGE